MAIVAINGYGVGHDPKDDPMYDRYLGQVAIWLSRQGCQHKIVFMGGATNAADVTEAAYMRAWFEAHAPGLGVFHELVEPQNSTRGAWDNLRMLRDCIGSNREVYIFCLNNRAWKMEVMAKRLFRYVDVIGVEFVSVSMAQHLQWSVSDVIEVVGFSFPPFAWLSQRIRLRHLARERARREQQ